MRTILWRRLTFYTRVLLAVTALLAPARGMSQTNAENAKSERISNRYLIIVETSRTMIKRGDGILETVNTLILNGMKGQMNSGDTLGMWTFNDKLHAGDFPLQVWTPENRARVAENAGYFIKRAKFEKKSRIDETLSAVKDLVRDSDYITVLFLTDGSTKFNGTPFDKEINEAFASWKPEQDKKQMPILTVLRASKGVITHHAIVPVPWTWEMPPLPPELIAAYENARKQIAALTNKPPPAPAIGQPLIVRGTKSNPAPTRVILTNKPALTTSNAVPVKTATTTTTPTNLSPRAETTTPATTVLAPKPSIVSPVTNPVPSAILPPQKTDSASVPAKPAAAVAAPTEPKPTAKAPPATTPGADQKSALSPATSMQLAQANPRSAPGDTPAKTPEPAVAAPPVRTAPEATSPVLPQQGALVPPPTIWENEWFWVGIGIATLVAVIVTFSLMRRSHSTARVSLITSSYDRDAKP